MHRTSGTVIPLLKGKIGLSSATIGAEFNNLAGVMHRDWRLVPLVCVMTVWTAWRVIWINSDFMFMALLRI
jgi:hypothetical protein